MDKRLENFKALLKKIFWENGRLTVGHKLGWDISRNGYREFPGSPVVRTRSLTDKSPGSIPGQGNKIPQVTQCGQHTNK